MQVDRNTNQHPLRPQGVGIFTDYADTMEKLYAAARRRSLKLMPSAGAGPDCEQGWDAEGGAALKEK
ncbi:MAG TPA: hypothetical protein VET51_05310 [Burkholderiales bacterium]|nr:hypothetical protein [Burkholderiales bacterium]